MAWIRLDDQIAHHPKVLKVGLSAWLYVGCIAFAQRFLTDGFIPDDAIPTLCGGVEKPILHIRKLVAAGLLERTTDGYQVHDYLDFNESAATVKKRREEDRKRKHSERIPDGIQTDSGRIPAGVLARAPASSPIPSSPIPSRKKEQANLEAVASTNSVATKTGSSSTGREINARSRRPIFTGQRFVVFDWMLEDMARILGDENLDRFDVHEWFFELDARVAKTNITLQRSDVWPWLQSELVKESVKRGIPLMQPDQSVRQHLGKQTQRLIAAIASAKDTL